MQVQHHYDVVIIGSGAAGASLAIRLASTTQTPPRIALISKGPLSSGSTFWAQGGIAAAVGEDDSPTRHAEDTLVAGAGLCDPHVVKHVTEAAPSIIDWLVAQGVVFSQTTDRAWHLGQEGGHQARRILHTADATGKVISDALIDRVKQLPIETFEHTIAIDIIRNAWQCQGLYALHGPSQTVLTFASQCVVLATGGASHVYGISSNPDCSSGDGIAIAERARCAISHMEFNQFHPTCLFHPQARSFLITEALRGEGAQLRNGAQERFMPRYHPDAELAPRDIVARAIDNEIKHGALDHVWLDISHEPADQIRSHFPTIDEKCLSLGIDITQAPIPVVPAAHYSCGGVVTNLQGQTTLPQLYAIGEVAYTGLHGANRLASNSLLECLVLAESAAEAILDNLPHTHAPTQLKDWDASRSKPSQELAIIRHHWHAIQKWMWDYVGIVRSDARLQHALEQIRLHQRDIQKHYENWTVTRDLIELRNLAQVAELMILAALRRHHNVGLHFNQDDVAKAA